MVGRDVDDLYPRSPAAPRRDRILEVDAFGADVGDLHASSRRDLRHRRACLAPDAPGCCDRFSASSPSASGRVKVGAGWAGRLAASQLAGRTVIGHVERGSKGRRSRCQAARRRQPDAVEARRSRARAARPPARQDDVGPDVDRAAGHQVPRTPAASRELSGGNQQKVALARLLHHDVDVLLLDEPTRGIDVGSKAQIYSLLDALVSDKATGRARSAARQQLPARAPRPLRSDRVMRRGRLGPARAASELTEHQMVMDATGAEDAA